MWTNIQLGGLFSIAMKSNIFGVKKDWMISISIVIKFTVLKVPLGYIHYDESLFHCVNYIILMGKHFVNASRDGKKPMFKFIPACFEK